MMKAVQVDDYVELTFKDQGGTKPYKGVVSRVWNGGHQFQLEDARFEIIDPRVNCTVQ